MLRDEVIKLDHHLDGGKDSQIGAVKRGREAARKLVGVEDVHPHELRNTAASCMVGASTDIYTVGKMIGHAFH